MKAAVLREVNKPLEIEDIQHGDPAPREVLVRTVAAGEAVGSDVTYVKPGDHVITCLSAFCGHCEHCLTGHMSLCGEPELQRPMDQPPRLANGDENIWQFLNLSSFAEYMLVHEHAIAKVREDMPMAQAALIGCGVTTGVGAVIHTAGVEPGTSVAVIGCGGVGLSAINGAAIAGAARIIAIDMVPSKLDLARKFGATDVVNAAEVDPIEAVRELTGGGVHYSFEAIGLKQTAEQSFKMLSRGGTATVIGMIPMGVNVELHGPEFLQERTFQGSNMGSNRFRVDMPRFVEFYLQGRLHLDDLISRRIKLEDVNEGLAALETGEVARSVIMFD
jgi:S-(hydroxymethyl)glutathione dehydrogenase/alcohol dehydrogenase